MVGRTYLNTVGNTTVDFMGVCLFFNGRISDRHGMVLRPTVGIPTVNPIKNKKRTNGRISDRLLTKLLKTRSEFRPIILSEIKRSKIDLLYKNKNYRILHNFRGCS